MGLKYSTRHAIHPAKLREGFLAEVLFIKDTIQLVYALCGRSAIYGNEALSE